MTRVFGKQRAAAVLLALPAVFFAGCYTCGPCGPCGSYPGDYAGLAPLVPFPAGVDNCATIPPGAIPAPVGTYLHKFIDLQAAKAEADDFVIYNYEWYLGGRDLGPFGRYHLNEIARRLASVPFPVVVEPSLDLELNEARRQVIVDYLAQYGVPNPQDRVILAFPQAGGLYGEEAVIMSYRFYFSAYGYGGYGLFGGLGFGGFGRFGLLGGALGTRGRFFGGVLGGLPPF